MEEISTVRQRNFKPLISGVVAIVVIIIILFAVSQFLKKQNLVSPLEDLDNSNVKVIFVTPEPSSSPKILESSPSAAPKVSPKVKTTPKPSVTPANSASPSASPN